MRAHLVQLDMAWEAPEENFRRVGRLLDGTDIGPGDLVLLPEMFATGFSLNTEVTADKGGVTLRFLQELAEDLGCWVQGGRTVHDCHCTKADNRMSVLSPEGALVCEYTKVHPFSFGREPERFAGGDRVETWEWTAGGERAVVCPAVCYDLRFPELFRIGAVRGAEVFALGACWPAARASHWRALAIARAIENQGVVLAVNRTGNDPHLAYAGGTIAVDAKGEVLGELGEEPGVLSVGVDIAAVREWREVFPALKDVRLREIR
ncbi:MAG: nitrilase-related carbon-nitrogen hydrolase [Phycisphaerales bacterium JB054]